MPRHGIGVSVYGGTKRVRTLNFNIQLFNLCISFSQHFTLLQIYLGY